MLAPTSIYFGDYALNMLWCSACASTSSHDVMSAHNDVRILSRLVTFRILCSIPQRGHPGSWCVFGFLLALGR